MVKLIGIISLFSLTFFEACNSFETEVSDEVTLINTAYSLSQEGKHQDAINVLQTAKPVVRDFQYLYHFNLANEFYQVGAFDSALQHYKLAYIENPTDTCLSLNYSLCKSKLDSLNQDIQSSNVIENENGQAGQKINRNALNKSSNDDAKLLEKLNEMNMAKRARDNKHSKRERKEQFW